MMIGWVKRSCLKMISDWLTWCMGRLCLLLHKMQKLLMIGSSYIKHHVVKLCWTEAAFNTLHKARSKDFKFVHQLWKLSINYLFFIHFSLNSSWIFYIISFDRVYYKSCPITGLIYWLFTSYFLEGSVGYIYRGIISIVIRSKCKN